MLFYQEILQALKEHHTSVHHIKVVTVLVLFASVVPTYRRSNQTAPRGPSPPRAYSAASKKFWI
jgi:hypothetical protein